MRMPPWCMLVLTLWMMSCADRPEADLGPSSNGEEEEGAGDDSDGNAAAVVAPVYITFNGTIQRSGWGETTGRCQIEVSFLTEAQKSEVEEAEEGDTSEPDWVTLNQPENAGECVITIRDPDEWAQWQAEHVSEEDNWSARGTLYAGERVYLSSSERTLELELSEAEDGTLSYGTADCSADSFPFGRVFSLEVPEGIPEEGVEPFVLDDALAIGPDIILIQPDADDIENDTIVHYDDQPLLLEWNWDGGFPSARGEDVQRQVTATIRNNEVDGSTEIEVIVCNAEAAADGEGMFVEVSPELLQALSLSDHVDGDYWQGIQIDSGVFAQDFVTPYGESFEMKSYVSIGGFGDFVRAASTSNADL